MCFWSYGSFSYHIPSSYWWTRISCLFWARSEPELQKTSQAKMRFQVHFRWLRNFMKEKNLLELQVWFQVNFKISRNFMNVSSAIWSALEDRFVPCSSKNFFHKVWEKIWSALQFQVNFRNNFLLGPQFEVHLTQVYFEILLKNFFKVRAQAQFWKVNIIF